MGKGSKRRKENTKKFSENYQEINWTEKNGENLAKFVGKEFEKTWKERGQNKLKFKNNEKSNS